MKASGSVFAGRQRGGPARILPLTIFAPDGNSTRGRSISPTNNHLYREAVKPGLKAPRGTARATDARLTGDLRSTSCTA